MKHALIFTFILVLFNAHLQAQYSKPYRIAYDEDRKSYLICNRGDGSITNLDSNYKTKTVITGLKDPRDVVFASIGGNKGILILDGNALNVYDASTYSKLISYAISNAKDIESIVFDISKPGDFYLSDLGANKIIKGVVGGPPFYTPSYSVVADTGLYRPKGLLFDNKGRLLVVSDSANSSITEVNVINGSSKVLIRTGLDSANSLVQDKEGNFYLTNWGDSYMYRLDSDLKKMKRLAGFNKPSGMYVNKDIDLLITACTNCGKIDFQKLHWFEPSDSVENCEFDSLTMNVSPLYNGIGTFNSGNRFIVQLSNANGSFTSPKDLGYVELDSNPTSIEIFLPIGNYTGNYLYRLKSTNPVHYSTTQKIKINEMPNLRAYASDSVDLCKGSTLKLGTTSQSNTSYAWTPGIGLSDSTSSATEFTATSQGQYAYQVSAKDTLTGCSALDHIVITVNDNIVLNNLTRNIRACRGTSKTLGVNGSPYDFNWSPSLDLSSNTSSNPVWTADSNRTYQISLFDPITQCSGKDSVQVLVDTLPDLNYLKDSFEVCAKEEVLIGNSKSSHPDFLWQPSSHLEDSLSKNPKFSSLVPGAYDYTVTVKDGKGCEVSKEINVMNHKLPFLPFVLLDRTSRDSLKIIVTATIDDSLQLFASETSGGNSSYIGKIYSSDTMVWVDKVWTYFQFMVESDFGCKSYSDSIEAAFTGTISPQPYNFIIYPNPANKFLTIDTENEAVENVKIFQSNGQILNMKINPFEGRLAQLNTELLLDGFYILEIEWRNGATSRSRMIILHTD